MKKIRFYAFFCNIVIGTYNILTGSIQNSFVIIVLWLKIENKTFSISTLKGSSHTSQRAFYFFRQIHFIFTNR